MRWLWVAGLLVLGLLLLWGVRATGCAEMPRGHPDWQVNTGQFSFVDFNTGELAARLGSPFVFTRSGRVVAFDNFECGLGGWFMTLVGAASSVQRYRTFPWQGAWAARLTAGGVANDFARMRKRIPFVSASKVGLEFMLWQTGEPLRSVVQADFQTADWGGRFTFRIYGDGTIAIVNSSGSEVILDELGAGNLSSSDPIYFPVEFVIDGVLRRYDRMRVADRLYGLTAYSPEAIAVAPLGRVEWLVNNVGNGSGSSSYSTIDNVVFTIDEP